MHNKDGADFADIDWLAQKTHFFIFVSFISVFHHFSFDASVLAHVSQLHLFATGRMTVWTGQTSPAHVLNLAAGLR